MAFTTVHPHQDPANEFKRLREFKASGAHAFYDFGGLDATNQNLSQAHALASALACAEEHPEYATLNESIRTGAMRGLETLISLAAFNLDIEREQRR